MDNHIGKRFGLLVVISQKLIVKEGQKNYVECHCICDCGQTINVKYSLLRNKSKNRSCGCILVPLPPIRKSKNIVGIKFNSLTVRFQYKNECMPPGRNYETNVIAECECGKIVDTTAAIVKRGTVKSCGCLQKINVKKACSGKVKLNSYIGKRFGKLVVFAQGIEKAKNRSYAICYCECDCGNITEVYGHQLSKKIGTRSCGCLNSEAQKKVWDELSFEKKKLKSDLQKERMKKGHPWYKDGKSQERHNGRRAEMATLEYKEWRRSVFKRDNYTCQHCFKKDRCDIQAHHIKSWAEYPDLRLEVSNGMTLCVDCHKRTPSYGKTLKGRNNG